MRRRMRVIVLDRAAPPAYSRSAPPAVTPGEELAHLQLLLGAQAVVEVSRSGNHLGALAAHGGGLGFDEALRAFALELGPGDERLDIGARIRRAGHQRDALLLQLVRKHGEALLLRSIEVELAADAIDHPFAHFGGVCLAHRRPIAVAMMAAGGEAADEDG